MAVVDGGAGAEAEVISDLLFDRAISAAARLVLACDRLRGLSTLPSPRPASRRKEESPVTTDALRDGAGHDLDSGGAAAADLPGTLASGSSRDGLDRAAHLFHPSPARGPQGGESGAPAPVEAPTTRRLLDETEPPAGLVVGAAASGETRGGLEVARPAPGSLLRRAGAEPASAQPSTTAIPGGLTRRAEPVHLSHPSTRPRILADTRAVVPQHHTHQETAGGRVGATAGACLIREETP